MVVSMKPISTDEFINKCKKVHGDLYDYSKTVHLGARKKITVICHEHGEFEQTASRHSNGRGCQKCGGTARLTTEEFIASSKIQHGDKYDYSKSVYTTSKAKVTIICPKHGEFEQDAHAHSGGKGCKKCSDDEQVYTRDEIIDKCRIVHGDKYDYSELQYAGILSKVKITCPIHGAFEQIIESHIQGAECRACNGRQSRGEKEMIQYIRSNTFKEVLESSNVPGSNLELDAYIPELKLAFEYNGVFTHSEYRKPNKYYHSDKTRVCAENGIRLVHIWEDDWRDNKLVEQSFIKSLLCKSTRVVYARHTIARVIESSDANGLLTMHHVQGFVRASTHIGLFHNDILIAVGSFTNRPSGVELVRYVSSIPVIGGLGKICKSHGGTIYTFCDNSRYSGDSYKRNGFIEQDSIPVDYKYVVKGKRVHKFNFRKRSIIEKYPNVKRGTELEMMTDLGIYRIWDCGKTRYIYQ